MRKAVPLLWIHELHAGNMLPACLWTYKQYPLALRSHAQSIILVDLQFVLQAPAVLLLS